MWAVRTCVALLWCWLACWLGGGVAGAQAATGLLREASAIAYDSSGNLYVADASANRVFEATLAGAWAVVAGTGVQGFSGDGGAATAAELSQPQGLAFGADGTMYIADTGNHRVRAVNGSGVISTVAGGGAGFSGDGGAAVVAGLRGPTGLGVDSAGALLICDTGNQRIRRVSGGTIGTIAGSGVQGFAGDGGPAVAAGFDSPMGVTGTADGRIFVADTHNNRVRVIGTTGIISTFAGIGVSGFAGDGSAAAGARLSGPRGVALDAVGDVLIADAGNERVRRVDASGVITTLAGSGIEGTSMDAAAELGAAVRAPRSVAVSSFGMAVFADTLNGAVRVVDGVQLYEPAALTSGRVSTVQTSTAPVQTYGSGAAVVTVAGSVGTPQGALLLTEAGSVVGSANLSAGMATLNMSALSAGSHVLLAKYGGDGLNPASSGSLVNVAVSPLALTATASSASVAYGAVLPQISGVLSGVLPADAGQVSAVFGVSAGGIPAVGVYPLTATLTGAKAADYTVSMSSSSGQLTVVKAGDTATLGAVGQAFAGIPLTLTATVAPSTRGQPTGTVQFLDGNVVVGTGVLSGGSASAVYAAPPMGARALSIEYLGDSNFLPSASGATMVSISALPDFGVSATGSQVASVTAGTTATYTLAVSAQPGPFTGAVTFSAAGQPAGSSVIFSPPAVVPGTGTATVTVTVQTVAPKTAMRRDGNGSCKGMLLALLGLIPAGFARRRPRMRMLCLAGVSVLFAGCGARTVGESTGGVVSQSYTVSVTGTATNLAGAVVTHATEVTLTVTQ